MERQATHVAYNPEEGTSVSRKHKRRGLLPALADQSWNSLTLYPPLKLSFQSPRVNKTLPRLPPVAHGKGRDATSAAKLQGNGGKGTDPPGIPLTALLGPYARKRKPKKKAAPVEPKSKRTSKTSKPAEGGATTQDLMRDTGKGSEGTMTLGATLSPGSMTGVMGLATVHFDTQAQFAPSESMSGSGRKKTMTTEEERKKKKMALRKELERKKRQLAPRLEERVYLDLYMMGRSEMQQMDVADMLLEESTDRQEHVRTQAEKRKYTLNKKSVFTRTANDVRAITQAKVKMRRQHNIQSMIRDSYIRESSIKNPNSKAAMFRTRRKLAEIMFSKTAIVRMLKDGEADMFKPSDDPHDEGGMGKGYSHEGQKGEKKAKKDATAFKRKGFDDYIRTTDVGRVVKLPNITRRYGRNVTDQWLPGPVDVGIFAHRLEDELIMAPPPQPIDHSDKVRRRHRRDQDSDEEEDDEEEGEKGSQPQQEEEEEEEGDQLMGPAVRLEDRESTSAGEGGESSEEQDEATPERGANQEEQPEATERGADLLPDVIRLHKVTDMGLVEVRQDGRRKRKEEKKVEVVEEAEEEPEWRRKLSRLLRKDARARRRARVAQARESAEKRLAKSVRESGESDDEESPGDGEEVVMLEVQDQEEGETELPEKAGGETRGRSEEDMWVVTANGKRLRQDSRRLLRMMTTTNRHLNTTSARFRAAEHARKTGTVPAVMNIIATVTANSAKLKEEMEKKVLEECCMRRRAGKTRIHERAAEVFTILGVPAGPVLDFDLQMREGNLHPHIKDEIEAIVDLWETLCDTLYLHDFLRVWIAFARMDDGLIKAAATDPGVLLPDCILDYMVPKGIFRSQGDEAPVRWLEHLLQCLRAYYMATHAALAERCQPRWDESTNGYINDSLRRRIDDERLNMVLATTKPPPAS